MIEIANLSSNSTTTAFILKFGPVCHLSKILIPTLSNWIRILVPLIKQIFQILSIWSIQKRIAEFLEFGESISKLDTTMLPPFTYQSEHDIYFYLFIIFLILSQYPMNRKKFTTTRIEPATNCSIRSDSTTY